MARATARVELHEDDARTKVLKTTSDEYSQLHAEMWEQGFRRYVTNSDDEMKQLPPAEYSYEGGDSIDRLYEKIKTAAYAAVKSHKRYSFVLTRTTESRKWYNLETIEEDPDA
ncbi:hypothetical protein [Burkholderia cenocepacia]|uniref:hypothetical protein n=1 Tax=Burkholderia cenocepacia TaxID=95486 RepID=UPI0024B68B85|nr:hypothetical protein [Burkholderia cenocepacia]MDI9680981.1 hypothetical protein [Burkholderia cenocepacia]